MTESELQTTSELGLQQAVYPAAQQPQLNPLVEAVLSGKDIDPDKLNALLAIQERYEAGEAKKAFVAAVAAFKKDPPVVVKDRVNTQYDSMYTSEGNLINTVSEELARHGLTTRFDFQTADGDQRSVTCIMTHELGHSESVTLSGPLDKSGSKNDLQKIKSTNTYLKVATFEAVTGVSSSYGSTDDDGNAAGEVELVSAEQAASIRSLLEELDKDEAQFLKWVKAESVERISVSAYPSIISELEKRRKA